MASGGMVSLATRMPLVSLGHSCVSGGSGRVTSSPGIRSSLEAPSRRLSQAILAPGTSFLSASPTCRVASTRCSHSSDSRGNISASASVEGVSVASTSKGGELRQELKQKLYAAIDAADGNLNEECVSIINELAKENPNVGVLKGEEGRKLWLGAFEGVKASFKRSGKKGGAQSEVGYKGAPATLGRLSFNCFKPAGLDVFLSDFFNELVEEPQLGYVIITTFTFDNPRGEGLPPVDGVIFIRASYSNAGPDKQELVFQRSDIRPRFPERDLDVWKEVFAENPGMDEQGQCSASISDFKGSLDYVYVDDELRITKGNYGAHVVARKLPELSPELRLN